MSSKKKINIKKSYVDVRFSNWLAQLISLLQTKFCYLVVGRGGAKTSEFQAERLMEMVYDMPGAPVCWVSDTYSNLQKNILPTLIDGFERKGWREDIHYVIEKKPPEFSINILSKLPKWLKNSFWKPHNKIISYKHTMIFFSGFNITFGSLDRPSSLAGRSYVHIFGDEVKFFKEEKIAQLTKAVRGYKIKYGHSIFYRGHTFTTDMPNVYNIGEYDWILKFIRNMNSSFIIKILNVAFVLNEVIQEWISAKESKNKQAIINKTQLLKRWQARYYAIRRHPKAATFFFIASSYVNADILDVDFFSDEFSRDLSDVNVAILSLKPTLEAGDRFYANLGSRHFYADGNDSYWSEVFGLRDSEDCRILHYLNKDKVIEAGVDFGNMMSMLLAQPRGSDYRIIKGLYTLSPEWIPELAKKFVKYFEHHNEKVLKLYYDRAGNNYKGANQDVATKLKKAIQIQDNKPTGWKVLLMSEGQGNIGQYEEYIFMMELLSGHNRKLPNILIDQYNCKECKSSLELAPTRITQMRGRSIIVKQKKSENLPIHRLPLESTNFSDAFKYLMMRKIWRRVVNTRRSSSSVGDVSVRG